MTLPAQTQIIFLLNRLGIHPQVLSNYVIRFIHPAFVEIRNYNDGFDIMIYPKKWMNWNGEGPMNDRFFFCLYCEDIKELENNMLMLTKLL